MRNPGRRKKVKKLSNIFSPPSPSAKAEIRHTAQQRVEEHVVKALQHDRSPMTIVRLGLEAVRNCEGVSDTLVQEFKPTLACRRECDLCCYPAVSATVAEVANIVAYVETQLPPERRNDLMKRVHDTSDDTRALTSRQRTSTNIACPYLEDGLCSVYPVRPLACRGFNSYDYDVCQHAFNKPTNPPKIPAFTPLIVSAQGMKEGLASGLSRHGLPTPVVDLTKASSKLFQDLDGTLENWLEGRDVFADCRPF